MIRFVTGVLSGIVLTTAGIVTAALISIRKDEKKLIQKVKEEKFLITGIDDEECAKRLCSSLHDKNHIPSLEISFIGIGYEVLNESIEIIKSEITSFLQRNIDIKWNVSPQRFMESAIYVVVRY